MFRYAGVGAAFGLVFPAGATAIAILEAGRPLSWDGVGAVQRAQALLWIIDTAPVFLGLFAAFAGCRQDRLMKANADLERRVAERTRQMEQARDELEGRVRERTQQLQAEVLERRLAEAKLMVTRDEAEQANQAKSRFLAAMSHELRTPLNAVIGYGELLREEAEERGLRDLLPDLDRISGAARHLLELVNDVLDLSKIEAGRMALCPEPVGLADVVENIVSVARPLAARNGNELVAAGTGASGSVVADATRLKQVLYNLVSNACKFTEQGRVSLDVRRVVLDGREWVEFAVADTGIGIPKAQMGRIFDEFSQADPTTTRRYGGTGLGLAISQRFARLMGGYITVESEPGRGSCFTLRLPANGAAEAAGSAAA